MQITEAKRALRKYVGENGINGLRIEEGEGKAYLIVEYDPASPPSTSLRADIFSDAQAQGFEVKFFAEGPAHEAKT